MFIGLIMFVGFVVQCGKKKKETNKGSKGQLLEQSTMTQVTAGAGTAAVNRQNPQKSGMQKSAIGNGTQQVEEKPKTPGNGKNGKAYSKKKSKKTKSEKSQSSNKEGAPMKPMDPIRDDPNDDPPQAHPSFTVLKAEECNKMDVTIEDFGNPAIHDRVSRAAATDMIFDPKVITYKGNVDDGKDKKDMVDVEKDILAACEKHDAKFSRNGKVVKTVESEKSKAAPADQRVKMKPDGCVLFETRELPSELFGDDEP
ncbi:uncharacterized protein CELE_F23B2.7 [Caenorhabditis elegans]|nr:Uncharacterized protein CELE_F23B2.7 [Caenorhabditis elegans]CAQ58107.1 Uncharacterized protein CELE_F23B2.7 [Caenorhabditis elegans]|eukprot:NP_001129856.1 Uncharacterized protein CELE_F23B2.7 [Caenorhabditis elegans]